MTSTGIVIKRALVPAVWTPHHQVTKQVYSLYRSKLRIASQMGYKIGDRADEKFVDLNMFNENKLNTYACKLCVGHMTWSHIYHTYRITINNVKKEYPFEKEMQDDALDYGFETLRIYNKMKKIYDEENKHKNRHWEAKNGGRPLQVIPKGSVLWGFPSG
jgi:hypothetical protein